MGSYLAEVLEDSFLEGHRLEVVDHVGSFQEGDHEDSFQEDHEDSFREDHEDSFREDHEDSYHLYHVKFSGC